MKRDYNDYLVKSFNFKRIIKSRNYIISGIFILIFTALIGKLYYIQFYKREDYTVMANKQYYYEENISNMKYKLLGRNNEHLFDYENKYYVVVDPIPFIYLNENTNSKEIDTITYILRNYNKKYDLSQLKYAEDKSKRTYEVDIDVHNKIKEYPNVKGIYAFKSENAIREKNWKIENLITHTEKYSKDEKKDKNSLEMQINDMVKNNEYPKVIYEKNTDGKIIDEKIVENEDNVNVRLTLDKNIQNLVKDVLNKKDYEKYKQIGVTLVESNSGNILAMSQKNDNISNVNIGIPSNNGFLVGSVFKTLVLECALDNNIANLEDTFSIKNIFPKSNEIKSTYSLQEAYLTSSNDVFAQLGWKVGSESMNEYAKNHGLLEKNLGLHDETKGKIEGIENKEDSGVITNTSIGQTVRATPLAVTSIPSVIVNNGIYVKPRIIDAYVDNNNKIIKELPKEEKRIISEKTAELLENEMNLVVKSKYGTGKNANVEGIYMGAKTGTTEYFVEGKEYSDGWFVGFFQYNGKYYSLVVFIPEIDIEKDAGGRTAAYLFKDIVENLVKSGYI